MDKEIVITISDREAYYLALSVAWKRGQRKQFGVSGLGDKIFDQLMKEISERRLADLNEEWKGRERRGRSWDRSRAVTIRTEILLNASDRWRLSFMQEETHSGQPQKD